MRHFVVLGQNATASDEFLLDDLPGTSGRLDVLLRCVRASLLHSHGIRRDTTVYLVLGGGPRAPRTLRICGGSAKFVRPDERSLATLVKKVLATDADRRHDGFVELKPGIAIARAGLEDVIADLGDAVPLMLDEHGVDIRVSPELGAPNVVFFVGDHQGIDAAGRHRLASHGARPVSVGPLAVHADDAIALATNEVDRRRAAALTGARRLS